MFSVRLLKPTLRVSSWEIVSMRCFSDLPSLSSRHTTSASPSRTYSSASLSPVRSAFAPLAVSVKILLQPSFSNCSSRFLSRLVCWNYAAFFIFSAVGFDTVVREMGGQQSSIKRRLTCPTVFSFVYQDQLSGGNGTERSPVAMNFNIIWAKDRNKGQRRTPCPERPW